MIPDLYKPLIERLAEKTAVGAVNWRQTSDQDTLAVHLRDFSLAMTRSFERDDSEFVRWEVLNERGDTIDGFYVDERSKDWGTATSLYDAARRKALRIDVALQTMMEELKKDRVGLDEKPSPAWGPSKKVSKPPFDVDDDELPF